ncbi:MAG: sulfotransferase [Pseudomonadota bacterium]
MTAHTPVFIVGTGRCGSTLMSNLINLHPDILSLSEVFVSFSTEGFVHREMDGAGFWRHLNKASPVLRKAINPTRSPVEFTYEFAQDSPWTMETLPACLYMTLPHLSREPDALYREMEPHIKGRPRASMAAQYQFWFDWLKDRHDKKVWMERSGNSITMVKQINRLWPDAKFVHIHRDGREVAMSIRNFMPLRVFLHTWQRLKLIGVDLLKTPFRYSDSLLVNSFAPVISSIMPTERFLDTEPSPIETGRFWSAMIEQGLKDLSAIDPARIHTMTYTDLVEQPRETLSDFLDFAAPDLPKEPWLDHAATLPRKNEAKWKALPQEEIKALEVACAPGMKLLGYI